MSSRVTRSSARLSAGSSNPNPIPPPATLSQPSNARKRKAPPRETSPIEPESADPPSRTRSKRAKVEQRNPPPPPAQGSTSRRKKRNDTAMSSAGPSTEPSEEKPAQSAPSTSKRTSRKKGGKDAVPPTNASSSRRTRKTRSKNDDNLAMDDSADGAEAETGTVLRPSDSDHSEEEEDEAEVNRHYAEEDEEDEEDDDDPFGTGFLSRAGGPAGLSHTLRALSGIMSGMSSRLRTILENMRSDDISVQLSALQDFSELLLVSTEDNLAGHFSPDQYVKELVKFLDVPPGAEEFVLPDIQLYACRCLANLMEALPAATANVVYGGAVPILCSKLLIISDIELAEQTLSTLEKISVEFPATIVREGGLNAILTPLEFFATGTQRTAVTTVANCSRNVPEESFDMVKEAMPTLLNVLGSSDQKVVEQACLSVTRLVESFRTRDDKLEQLVSTDLLRAILGLLIPGSTNMINANIHTLFLKTLWYTARASPRLSVELLRMNVVDTLYQILTGTSPPSGTEDIATKIDSVVVMQALIHRPREQIFETLNVICELLPDISFNGLAHMQGLDDESMEQSWLPGSSASRKASNEKRIELLEGCTEELKRFAVILLPTLTDAYSSTVNLMVREKVLTAHLKMLSNLSTDILQDALRTVPYASFLASIFTQKEHTSLVKYALQAAELLLVRLEPIYRYQFYREGVFAEISSLASRTCTSLEETLKSSRTAIAIEPANSSGRSSVEDMDVDHDPDDEEEEDERSDNDDDEDRVDHEENDSDSDSASSSVNYLSSKAPPLRSVSEEDLVTLRAKAFKETYEIDTSRSTKAKASSILDQLKSIAGEIKTCYAQGRVSEFGVLFDRLAVYFDGDALEGITSYELLTSGVIHSLLEIFSQHDSPPTVEAKMAFLQAFMGYTTQGKQKTTTASSPSTPFSILVSKLQDLLSRSEHFEVITVHQNPYDSNRSSAASMLAKQLRLKLVADEESGIPHGYRNIMVSIHAVATFKALDDYLRPRISLAERPRRSRDNVSNAIAAYAAALAGRGDGPLPPPPTASDTTNRSQAKKTPKASTAAPAASGSTPGTSSSLRSSRRNQAPDSAPPSPPPLNKPSGDDEQLECADEERLSDEDIAEDDDALNAIVDDLEDDHETPGAEQAPVNMEVASTGKVTARREDGTRVATPVHNPATSRQTPSERLARLAALARGTPSPQTPGAPMGRQPFSYAAAVQSTPQDWHLEFSVNGQRLANDTTVYRAVHFNPMSPNDISSRTIWSAIHTINFKRVPGPPPASSTPRSPTSSVAAESGLPLSLDKNPMTSTILRLLSILHEMNANIEDVLAENKQNVKLNREPLSQFVNTKLTAKLNRQLEEPLIVASNCLPTWSEDLARLYPFLFPFETRHLFLQSTSFGYSRSMTRWQNSQTTSDSRHNDRPFLGRIQRQKVRISRAKILESGIKVMEMYGDSPSILEVEYFEEVGTGLGPTLEFYSTVSREFCKKRLKLWRENESNKDDEYAFGKQGLFPAPITDEFAQTEAGKRILHFFRILGKFVARSMLDSRIIDIAFNPTFFRVGSGSLAVKPSLGAIASVDEGLARSLKLLKQFANAKKQVDEDPSLTPAQKVRASAEITVNDVHVEDLALDFTLPGYPHIELIPGGSDIPVNIDNVTLYVDRVLDFTLGTGVQKQVDSFRSGFSEVFPYTALSAFTPDELVMLFGRVEEDWSLETLMDSVKADHGFNLDSRSVRNLLQVMSELNQTERRDFLQFVTGSPKLPIGGFKALTPMFTVVCKPSEPPYTSDDYLPSVMTCVNYLKMPDYSTLEILREKLAIATKEGQGAFHLS